MTAWMPSTASAHMVKRAALSAIFLSTLAVAAAYAAAFLPGGAPEWANWLLAMGIAVALTATMVLGAERNGRIGKLAIPFALVFLVIAGGFGLALALPASEGPGAALWLGLPVGAAIIMYGIGLLPFFIVPVAYALTFDEMILSEADLERVRRAAIALREQPEPETRELVAAGGER